MAIILERLENIQRQIPRRTTTPAILEDDLRPFHEMQIASLDERIQEMQKGYEPVRPVSANALAKFHSQKEALAKRLRHYLEQLERLDSSKSSEWK